MVIRHISMSIEGLQKRIDSLNNYQAKNKYCKSSFNMTLGQVKKSLSEYIKKGWEYIPADTCPNIGNNGACNCK